MYIKYVLEYCLSKIKYPMLLFLISKKRHVNKYPHCVYYSILVQISIKVIIIFRLYSKAPKLKVGSVVHRHNKLYIFSLFGDFGKIWEFCSMLTVLTYPT